jgi:prepilin-type N-terminal cleavage/methylation domain-containing protein
MILKALRRIHKDQRGFTLIEVLVVMTILGILAAIVSISLLGVTASARSKAKDAERQTVQAAFDAMLSDQQVDKAHLKIACPTTNGVPSNPPHTDMTKFPNTTAYAAEGSGDVTQLATHYLREKKTTYDYQCTDTGDIVQGTVIQTGNPY